MRFSALVCAFVALFPLTASAQTATPVFTRPGTPPVVVTGVDGGPVVTSASLSITGTLPVQGVDGGYPLAIVGTISSSNPSVGATGAAVPSQANFVGAQDGSGNLTGLLVNGAGALKTDSSATTQPVSGTVAVSNLPVTQPVSGSVSVSNLPATQPISATQLPAALDGSGFLKTHEQGTAAVSGSVSVLNFPGTQPVSGSVTATQATGSNLHVVVDTAPTTAVTGTFFQATQPVSAAALPLPTGAATLAKQPALGTAGSAAADVITVQGIAAMTALKTDGSAVTQPVSGTVAVSNFPATQPVSGTVTASVADATASGTLASLNATLSLAVAGHHGAGFVSPGAGNFVGTFTAQVSFNNGSNWTLTYFYDPATGNVALTQVASAASSYQLSIFLPSGATNVRIVATAYTSGTTTATLYATAAGNWPAAFSGNIGAGVQPPQIAQVGGWDSANLRAMKVDSAGVVQTHENGTATVSGTVTATVSGTVTSTQGTAAAAAGAWPTKVTDGTNTAAVKAASTASATTDPALVVALSPNSPLYGGAKGATLRADDHQHRNRC
jgi:hypothetical protein